MKKFISLILSSLVLFHGISQFLVFKIFEVKYKSEIKQMIKNGVPEDQLVYFSFHKNIESIALPNFKWMKKNEFRYNNEMYDIVEKKYSGDSIIYKCIHDVKESKLFANLDRHINSYLEKNPSKRKDMLEILNSLSKFYSPVESIETGNINFSKIHFNSVCYSTVESEIPVPSPPPRT